MKSTLAVLFVILGQSLWSWLGGGSPAMESPSAPLATSVRAESGKPALNLDLARLEQLGIESPERITAMPIQDIRVGMRVPAMNPQVTDDERAAFDLNIDPATWRKFTLEVEKQDGSGMVAVTLLRPSSWLVEEALSTELALLEIAAEDAVAQWEQQPAWLKAIDKVAYSVSTDSWLDRIERASPWAELSWSIASSGDMLIGVGKVLVDDVNASLVADAELERALDTAAADIQSGGGVGLHVWLDMPELGAVGFGKVVGNEPCEETTDGPGQVVTATFDHESADVLDLTFSSGNAHSRQTLGVTATHPFWSVTRDDFIPAGELKLHEEVTTIDGQTWRLTSITSRAGPQAVYNFEVAGEHVYYVSGDGLLVHNHYGIHNGTSVYGKSWQEVLVNSKRGIPDALAKTAKRLGKKLHGHHIVMKGKFSGWLSGSRKYVRQAQDILKRAGIDINDTRNLAHAYHEGHSKAYAMAVAQRLEAAAARSGNLQKNVTDALNWMRRRLEKGKTIW